MRRHGCIREGSGIGADAHACWTFHRSEEFFDASIEYLTDGIRAGQRLVYVGSEPVAEQRERLDPLGGVGGMIDKGALQLFELGDLYRVGQPIDPDAQLAAYLAAVDAARTDGYTGLRVAAQATDLVADPETWEAQIRWESIIDRVFPPRSLSVLCGYERGALPSQLLADLAAVHPAANGSPEQVPFHLFSESGSFFLAGEVDFFSAPSLDRVFDLVCRGDEPVALDLGELGFIDHHGLEVLAAHTSRLAETGGCKVQHQPHIVTRLCDLLELQL